MGDSKLSYFVTDIILLIVFLGLTRIIFRYSGLGFLLELLFVVALLLISFIALVPAYSGSRAGWSVLSGVFILVILDLLFIYLRTGSTGKVYLGTLLLAALGFVIATTNIKKEAPLGEPEEEAVYTNFEPPKKPKAKPKKKAPKKRSKKKR